MLAGSARASGGPVVWGPLVNHRAARLSLAVALLLSMLVSLVGPATSATAVHLPPSEILLRLAELPPGFEPFEEAGVASLLPDNLARQAAASFRRESSQPGISYVRQVVLAFDGRDATEYVPRFQSLMVKHQGYGVVDADESGFRLTRTRGEETSAVAAKAQSEMLIVTTVAGPAGTLTADDATSLTRVAVARVPLVDLAASAIGADPDSRSLANAQPGAGHLDIPNQQDAAGWPQAVANLPPPPPISIAEARSQRPVGDPSLNALMPIQNVARRPANWDTDLNQFMLALAPLLNEFWNRALSMTDVDYYPPRLVVVPAGEVVLTGCLGPEEGGRSRAQSLSYCPMDMTVYAYEPFIKDVLLEGADWRTRDYIVATAVAHEWGHHIQNLTNLLLVNAVLTVNQIDNAPLFSRQRELQADCYAGLFTRYARDGGWLNAGDLEEAREGMLRAGDWETAHVDHHGTPEQRREWFMRGYVRYTFRDCEAW